MNSTDTRFAQSLIEGYLKMTNSKTTKNGATLMTKTSAISHIAYKRNSSNEVVMVNSVYSTLYFSCREHQKAATAPTFITRTNDSLLEVHFPTDSYTTFRERF